MLTGTYENAPPQSNVARGDFVVRQGTFFQVGEYPDKQFVLSEKEADAAIQRFTPVPLNIEHIPTIFDGKLGFVQRLWRDGKNILAEYMIPRWLQDVTEGEPIKISSEWNRVDKLPIAGAFVLHPRVADAVMQAAFAEGERRKEKGEKEKGERATLSIETWKAEDKNSLPSFVCVAPKENNGCLRSAAFRVGAESACGACESGGNVGKETAGMALLAGLRALFARAGVSAEEIDRHLTSPLTSLITVRSSLGEGSNVCEPLLAQGSASVLSAVRSSEDASQEKGSHFGDAQENVATEVSESEAEAARFTQMEAELNRLRQQAQEAEQAARFTVDSRLIDGWVRAFQMTPAEADAWKTVARETPAAFAAAISALNMRPRLPQLVGSATVRASETADVGRLEALTQQKMRTSGLDHTAAFKEACAENRDLAQAVRARSQEGN